MSSLYDLINMPKKSKFSRGNRGERSMNPEDMHYFGRDDRVERNDGAIDKRPKVFFKKQPRHSTSVTKVLAYSDYDIPMVNGFETNGLATMDVVRARRRFLDRTQGRNNPLPPRMMGGGTRSNTGLGIRGGSRGQISARIGQLPLGDSSWYKIYIPYGHKYDKMYVLNTLLHYMAPETFVPIMYKISGNDASFYVDDKKAANALLVCDRKITTTDGFKLQVKVAKSGLPQCDTANRDSKLEDILKEVVARRFVSTTSALDLSKFYRDPSFAIDYFCPLFRPGVMKTVLDFAMDNMPQLEALNLDGNKLIHIDRLTILNTKFPKLKILYIGENKLKEINQLDPIKDLKLEELRLEGNPLCNKYISRQNDYISDVRKRFPKLLRLDGVDLPKPILFDVVDEGSKIPPSQRMCVANAKAQEIASQFLQQYFLIYDSENRQPLLDAYDEHACISMTVNYSANAKLNQYLSENRNLYRINDLHRRQKLLKQGRLPVVSLISELPQTKHYLDTFTMDINLVTEGMMLITVTGLFQQVGIQEPPNLYFNRTFIIVPQGNGYCIKNEQLHISHPTENQTKRLNARVPETQMSQPSVAASASSSSTIVQPVAVQLSEEVKQQMVLTLSHQTNMIPQWSLKCLEEVQWNYDNALATFQEFFKRGQIPAEAFSK